MRRDVTMEEGTTLCNGSSASTQVPDGEKWGKARCGSPAGEEGPGADAPAMPKQGELSAQSSRRRINIWRI